MPTYDDIRGALKTGDLVLFSGKSRFSTLIKLVSRGKWSHVGLVLVEPGLHADALLWESTTLCDVPDVEHGAPKPGVQTVPLRERLARYDGEVTVRHLSRPLDGERLARVGERRALLARRPFQAGHAELARAVYDGPGGASPREDLATVFCAELVAEVYQAAGLLPEWPDGLPSNEYVPLDFSERRPLALLDGFALGPEVPLVL